MIFFYDCLVQGGWREKGRTAAVLSPGHSEKHYFPSKLKLQVLANYLRHQVRASLLRGTTGPPSPTPGRLSCLSPIVETNSRTAVHDEEDDQPEVLLSFFPSSYFLLLLPGGPAPEPTGRGSNGARAGASEDRGTVPRSFWVLWRIQSGLSRVESSLLQPGFFKSGLCGQVIVLVFFLFFSANILSVWAPIPVLRPLHTYCKDRERLLERWNPSSSCLFSFVSNCHLWK